MISISNIFRTSLPKNLFLRSFPFQASSSLNWTYCQPCRLTSTYKKTEGNSPGSAPRASEIDTSNRIQNSHQTFSDITQVTSVTPSNELDPNRNDQWIAALERRLMTTSTSDLPLLMTFMKELEYTSSACRLMEKLVFIYFHLGTTSGSFVATQSFLKLLKKFNYSMNSFYSSKQDEPFYDFLAQYMKETFVSHSDFTYGVSSLSFLNLSWKRVPNSLKTIFTEALEKYYLEIANGRKDRFFSFLVHLSNLRYSFRFLPSAIQENFMQQVPAMINYSLYQKNEKAKVSKQANIKSWLD
jgi:hypothetical protein